ncbi:MULTISPECIES: TIGR01244 family sulfur transferase [Psychrobacter]|uniref:TIGR01244 family sulfur transferase n=1 Tax=Psychrobacter TaxID=497 RepID=UPI001918B327|nr:MULTISPECIES: TIGR01244 family sulfur transferase [Psychrobacter]
MSHEISITGQITPDQVPMIAENGIKTIINNRPDGEEAGQPTSAELAAAAKKAGLAYKEISFASSDLNQTHVEDFADFFNQAEQPILMFCRVGARSTGIYEAAKKMDLLDD